MVLHGKKKRSHLGDTLKRSTGPCCARPCGHCRPFLVLPSSLGLLLPCSKTRIPCQTHRAISPSSNATAAHSPVLFSHGHYWARASAHPHPQEGARCLGLPQCVPELRALLWMAEESHYHQFSWQDGQVLYHFLLPYNSVLFWYFLGYFSHLQVLILDCSTATSSNAL